MTHALTYLEARFEYESLSYKYIQHIFF